MTDSTYTHITILADRTGSMGDLADPGSTARKADLATDGIKHLIREQAAQPGKVTFRLIQFDSQATDVIGSFVPADDEGLAHWYIMPRGLTPLLDAVAEEIRATGWLLAGMPEDEHPGRVFFVIGTDGQENASTEHSKQQVADMVAHQRDAYRWEFVFIGTDIDAFAEAGGIGVAAAGTLSNSGENMAAAYLVTNDAIVRSRASGQSVSYTDEERKKAQ